MCVGIQYDTVHVDHITHSDPRPKQSIVYLLSNDIQSSCSSRIYACICCSYYLFNFNVNQCTPYLICVIHWRKCNTLVETYVDINRPVKNTRCTSPQQTRALTHAMNRNDMVQWVSRPMAFCIPGMASELSHFTDKYTNI